MSDNDKFFLEEITGQHPEVLIPGQDGYKMLNEIADESEFRLNYTKETVKVCSFCSETTEEMFPVYNYRYSNIGHSCSNCMSDNYCVVCGEEPSENSELYSYELIRNNYSAVCEKCYNLIEESGTN